jgi:general secretion pathway protein N
MTARRSAIIAVVVLSCIVSSASCALAQPSDQSTGTLANPLEAQPLDRLSATRERPLFSPTRRPIPPPPPPPPEAAPVAVVPQPPNVQLFGIVMDDEGARALVRSGTEKVDRVQIGDDIGGWKVAQIEGRRLVLSLDGRFATFTLFSNDNGQQTPRDADQAAAPAGTQAPIQAGPVTNQSPSTPQAGAPPASETQSNALRRHRRRQ